MTRSILVNGITLDGITLEGANLAPLSTKIKTWQSLGCRIAIFGGSPLKPRIASLSAAKDCEFIELKNARQVSSRLPFVVEAFKRNLTALFHVNKLKNKYDAVYSISSVLDLLILPYFLKLFDNKIKMVAVFDNTVPFSGVPGNYGVRLLAWLFFRVSLILLKRADRIFAISRDLRNFLIKNGFDENRITVTGNAVEADLIMQSRKNDAYRIDALFIGRISDAKGIYDMLDVLNIVRAKYPDFQLALMGKGDSMAEDRFKSRVKEMGLENNVQLLGYKVGLEKFNIIKSCRCFWFLSLSESFGVSLLEAVCSGLPAFVYDLEPYKNIYKNNEVFIFTKNDRPAVANKVIEVFDNKDFENKAGKLLLHKYRWDKIAEMELIAINSTPGVTG